MAQPSWMAPPKPIAAHDGAADITMPCGESPDDFSDLAWGTFQGTQYLAGSSWDATVKIWSKPAHVEGTSSGVGQLVHQHRCAGYPLSTAWDTTGDTVFAALSNGQVTQHSNTTGESRVVAQHQQGVRSCHWISDLNCVVTGSWDGMVAYWDTREPTGFPSLYFGLGSRVYALDAAGHFFVGATSERQIFYHDCRGSTQQLTALKTEAVPRYEVRAIRLNVPKQCVLFGGVEGKLCLEPLSFATTIKKGYSRRLHDQIPKWIRDEIRPKELDIHLINNIQLHPRIPSPVLSAGSDGVVQCVEAFDYGFKNKMQFRPDRGPLTAAALSPDGNTYAYACGNDWHRGCHWSPPPAVGVYLHHFADRDLTIT